MSAPTSFTYQWKSAGSNATGPGATTATYTTVTADLGNAMTCTVTGVNSAGSAPATSSPTSAVISIPTTGNLINRVIFGGSGPVGTQTAASLIASGVPIKAFNTYASTMGTGGSSNFPASDASYALANNVELHISWDQINTANTFATILSGGNDASIEAFGNACAAHGKRILLRMWWEMNGNPGASLAPPGSNSAMYAGGQSLAQRCATWIQGWQYIYNKIKVTCGATNVLFWFCPNGNDGGAGYPTMEQCWPGINYVDVTGIDDYNNPEWGPWSTFTNLNGFSSGGMWSRLLALAPNLPMGIGETGCVQTVGTGQTQDGWLTSMFTCQTLPNLRWLDYFDYNLGDPNWAITTSASLAVTQLYAPQSLPAWQVF